METIEMEPNNLTPEEYAALSERRAGDRIKMALLLTAVAEAEGGTVRIIEHDFAPHLIRVVITGARGMFIGFDLDGGSRQPGVFVGTWNLPTRATHCFNPAVLSEVNPYHYQKVSVVAQGFHALVCTVRAHLRAGFNGTAFSAEIEAEERRKTLAGEQVWQQTTRAPRKRRVEDPSDRQSEAV